MIDTILFDLDGTLVRISQSVFVENYLHELRKIFIKLGLDGDLAIKALWAGTKAMMLNDGNALNSHRFWRGFADSMKIDSERLGIVEAACDSFYSNEFNKVKDFTKPSDIPRRLVRDMIKKGYSIVLATNPLFPAVAIKSRLEWIGLEMRDFRFVTHYTNSSFCKPNPEYYREVLMRINKKPEQCLMVGNNPAEDMVVSELGVQVFLVTDYMENEHNLDVSKFRQGSLEDLETYLMGLSDIA